MTTRALSRDPLVAPRPAAAVLEARALAGESQAWDELFRLHNRRVVLALLARGVRPDIARDVAQEAWMKLLEQARRGRLETLALPGLAVVQAMFLARDRMRRKEASFFYVPVNEAEQPFDPEKTLLDRDRLAAARAVIARCSASEQRVFEAMYASPGAPALEVAGAVGLSVQRVRQIVCEVRKKVRAALEDDHG